MSAQDTFSGIAKAIHSASEIIMIKKPLTANHLIQLSQIYYHILKTQVAPINVLMAQLELETNNTKSIRHYYEEIIGECDSFCSIYSKHKKKWETLCSESSLLELVEQAVNNEYGFRISNANAEKDRWEIIFKKFNEITKLYNSMDCRPGQEKEDMAIINNYLEELWDLVGHRIRLETINAEHDNAKKVLDEKWEVLSKLNQSQQRRAEDLLHQIEKNIIPVFFDYVNGVRRVLAKSNENTCSSEKKRGPGRPTIEKKFKAEGITDFASSFVDSNKYDTVKKLIENSDERLSGNSIFYLYEVLRQHNWLKPALKSVERFADFLIESFGEKVSITKGIYVYGGQDNPDYREYWRALLKLS